MVSIVFLKSDMGFEYSSVGQVRNKDTDRWEKRWINGLMMYKWMDGRMCEYLYGKISELMAKSTGG